MALQEVYPIIIPMLLMQVGIQAFYIRHCWRNGTLNTRQKALYIVLIALFNLPGSAFYFFFASKKKPKTPIPSGNVVDIDDVNKQGIFVLLLITFEILSFTIIFGNMQTDYYNALVALLGATFILIVINSLFIKRKHRLFYYWMPVVEILLVLVVYCLDKNETSQFLILIVVASVINNYRLRYSKFYSLIVFFLYLACITFKYAATASGITAENFLGGIYLNGLIYLLVYAGFYSMKKQLMQNQLLQAAYREVQEQSIKLEEMAAVTERNRIAGEIHDNVGHTLTTAIISIEAGENLLDKDKNAALEKFDLAREQIKEGLQSIRYSVQAIKQGADEKPFDIKVKDLLDAIRKNTSLRILDIVQIQSLLLPIQQKVLLMAVKECVTNSIKHGKSTQVDLLMQEYKGAVQMTISDNGTGAKTITFGSGLSFMRERVESIGGTMSAESEIGEGFTVNVTIPTGLGEGNKQ